MADDDEMLAALPPNLRAVLAFLREHGSWRVDAPWVWQSSTKTRIALKGLAHRGLAIVERDGDVLVYRPATVAGFVSRRQRARGERC